MSVVALTGGIGGAKLALGLYRILPPDQLTLVVNTGDDMRHLGLHIAPDVDTTVYTLAGCVNPETGWGRQDETWSCMDSLAQLGGETWFRLGDRDLALHLLRSQRLARGDTLAAITQDLALRFGVRSRILPMSNDPVPTRVLSSEGELDFQDYFVARRCQPALYGVRYCGAEAARACPEVLQALQAPDLQAVVLCPSNPWLSLGPPLALADLRAALRACAAPVVAVSPLVGSVAVKGPTDKIMAELGLARTPRTVADQYADFLDGFVLDERDADCAATLEQPVCIADTLMRSLADRERLARTTLDFALSLAKRTP